MLKSTAENMTTADSGRHAVPDNGPDIGQCAVLGSPVAHSLSPVMHNTAYRSLGMDWTYGAIDTDIDDLARVLARRDENGAVFWSGVSLTKPLKRAALQHVDGLSETTQALGVANTIIFTGERRKAHNTDVPGAIAALAQTGVTRLKQVRILGGGATAISLAHAAIRLGATYIEFRVRSPERSVAAVRFARDRGAEATATSLDEPILDVVDVVFSTVPDSAIGSRAHELVDAAGVVFDAIYDPWPTHLAAAATQRGRVLIGGLDLLAHQAARQVRLMTGFPVDAGLLRDAAQSELTG